MFAVVLAAGTTQTRADMITYNMTGTITNTDFNWTPSFGDPGSPVAVGDHISWTLQYNSSIPPTASGPGWNNYSLNSPVITNLEDRTNGIDLNNWAPLNSVTTTIELSNKAGSFAAFSAYSSGSYGSTELSLNFNGLFPTSSLTSLQLNSLPLNDNPTYSSSLQLSFGDDIEGLDFNASVDSISVPSHGTPEPGSLTLFLLGTAGLSARGIRRRLRFRLVAACLRRRLLHINP